MKCIKCGVERAQLWKTKKGPMCGFCNPKLPKEHPIPPTKEKA